MSERLNPAAAVWAAPVGSRAARALHGLRHFALYGPVTLACAPITRSTGHPLPAALVNAAAFA